MGSFGDLGKFFGGLAGGGDGRRGSTGRPDESLPRGSIWAGATWTSSVDVVVRADERVLRRLGEEERGREERVGEEGRGEQLLREHFEQLTLSFLQPLETFT